MLERLRRRAQSEEGFTLIELLVVILIIGILAAVAIPTFLNQTGKANAANVKTDINSAATSEETYYTDNQTYAAATGAAGSGNSTGVNALVTINGALTNAFGGTENLTIAAPSGASITNSYLISAVDPSGVTYSYTKASSGVISRSCTVPANVNPGGCKGSSGSLSLSSSAQSGVW